MLENLFYLFFKAQHIAQLPDTVGLVSAAEAAQNGI